MSSIIDDVAQVGWIVTILALSMVLSYPLTSITFGQAHIAAGRRCFFTLGTLWPVYRSVTNKGLALMVTH
jgi:hypothetical protein